MKNPTRTSRLLLLTSLTAGVSLFFACNKNNSSGGGTGRLEVRLTDAPANYEAVYIDVQSIEVNM